MSEFTAARYNMVESQIRPNDVTDSRILAAMGSLPREAFLPPSVRDIAYMGEDILVSAGASVAERRYLISPLCFAQMLQAADVAADNHVLDIGAGPGYSTAILARLADSVIGLESDEALAEAASASLAALEVDNAAVVTGDHAIGYEAQGPYDVIVLEGSVEHVPSGLIEQLKEGGKLVAVVGRSGLGKLTQFIKTAEGFSERPVLDAGCAPLPGFDLAPAFAL